MKEDLTIEEVEQDLMEVAKLLRDDFDNESDTIGMGIFTLALVASSYKQNFNKTDEDVEALVGGIVPEFFN
ncbi:hypothetical protein GH851_31095 [Bacillus thuringiensis]|nr:hypothetical protein [Bacillus thuringiensis]MRB84976.1 hypothetical protein [Bacillus thuringiensis]MRC26299.1 hypothetical protein [Bacillus thuringiensis]MRD45497.1 hypothetical protein [Bacillus thuringiensis]